MVFVLLAFPQLDEMACDASLVDLRATTSPSRGCASWGDVLSAGLSHRLPFQSLSGASQSAFRRVCPIGRVPAQRAARTVRTWDQTPSACSLLRRCPGPCRETATRTHAGQSHLRLSRTIKKTPPARPVTMPIGMSSGAMMVRATTSAQRSRIAPVMADRGRTRM